MFKINKLSWAISCVLALNGCALIQKDASLAEIDIKPILQIKHASESPRIMYLLGRYYQGKIDYQKAIAAYEKALAVKPNYVEVHNGLGVIYSIQGRYDLSLQHFHKAIEFAPTETYLYNNLGYAYLIHGNATEAIKSLEKAVLLDSENKRARLNLAIAHERANTTNKAASLQTDSVNSLPPIGQKISTTDFNKIDNNIVKLDGKLESQFTPTPPQTNKKILHPEDVNRLDNIDVRVEVSNGNGITGMAKQVSNFFQQYGLTYTRLTNHLPYNHPQTEIYYRSGNYQQANHINQLLPRQVKLVESKELRSDIQIKILLGQDFSNETAYFNMKDSVMISQLIEKTY